MQFVRRINQNGPTQAIVTQGRMGGFVYGRQGGDNPVLTWFREAHQGTGAVKLVQITDSNGFFDGIGIDIGTPYGAKRAGFEVYAGPFRSLDSPGSTSWTPYGVASNTSFDPIEIVMGSTTGGPWQVGERIRWGGFEEVEILSGTPNLTSPTSLICYRRSGSSIPEASDTLTGQTSSATATVTSVAYIDAPSSMTDLFPGFGRDTFRQLGYNFMETAGGSDNVGLAGVADRWWPNGEALKIRAHYGQYPDAGEYTLYIQYDDPPYEELDSGNRVTVDASGTASLQIAERDVTEDAIASGRPFRYSIMRGEDRPTAEQFIAGMQVSRTGMTYGISCSMLWAGGGQSSLDVANSLDSAPIGGLQAVFERMKADQVAQGITEHRFVTVWCHGVNDTAEATISKDGINASSTAAGYRANVDYCMSAIDAAAAAAGVDLGWLLIGPHVRPDNDFVGDDQADDEEKHRLYRAELAAIANTHSKSLAVDLATQVTAATKDSNSEYDAGSTAHQTEDGYLNDGDRVWAALGFSNTAPTLSVATQDNTIGSQVAMRVTPSKWTQVYGQVRSAASAAPSVADIKAGTGALGSGLATGKARPFDPEDLTITGLSGETDYIFYTCGTDDNAADSTVVSQSFTTPQSLWIPTDDANHFFTLDPDDATLSGSEVTSLPDKYGGGVVLAAASTGPDRIVVDGGPAMDFTTAERLRVTGISLPAPFTIFAMIRPDADCPDWARIISTSEGTLADASRATAFIKNGSNDVYGLYRGAIRGDQAIADGSLVLVQVTLLADGTVKTRINGGTETTESSTAYAGTLTYLALGARADVGSVTSSESFDGLIGVVTATKTDLSEADRQRYEGWIAHHYDTPANYLPGGHPYESSAP